MSGFARAGTRIPPNGRTRWGPERWRIQVSAGINVINGNFINVGVEEKERLHLISLRNEEIKAEWKYVKKQFEETLNPSNYLKSEYFRLKILLETENESI